MSGEGRQFPDWIFVQVADQDLHEDDDRQWDGDCWVPDGSREVEKSPEVGKGSAWVSCPG